MRNIFVIYFGYSINYIAKLCEPALINTHSVRAKTTHVSLNVQLETLTFGYCDNNMVLDITEIIFFYDSSASFRTLVSHEGFCIPYSMIATE